MKLIAPILLVFATAAVMEDAETAGQLIDASAMVGLPKIGNGELAYALMPTVGQAVILFGKTLLLKPKD